MLSPRQCLIAAALNVMLSGSALAAVSAEEAKQLGGPVLTEWGAERAGNKDGTIPAWTEEKITPPASYNPATPHIQPDPWGDKPLYTITAQNMAQYAEKLTDGQKAMFKTYPDYRMNIYKTHRTTNYPKYILDNSVKNATSCKAVNGGLRLEGCHGGIPFPIPKNGYEAMWNFLVYYQGESLTGKTESWLTDANGKNLLQSHHDVHYSFPYWDQSRKESVKPESYYWKLRFEVEAPARKNGEKYVILYALDPINPGQRAWSYIPGQRRVKLAPDLSYDTPSPISGGSQTMDEAPVYLGAMDRYDMKYIGKRETYLVANSNMSKDINVCPVERVLRKNFPNPDCMRWELHRTDVVEARLKPGFRHILPHRFFYLDEDKTGAGAGDAYDAAGKIYRVDNAGQSIIYDAKGNAYSNNQVGLTSDLQTGVSIIAGYAGCKGCGLTATDRPAKPETFFSPEAIAGEGIR